MYDIDSLFTIQLEENADGNKLIEHLGKYFEEFPQNIELDRFFSYDKPTGLPDNPTVADLLKSYVGKVEKAIKDERASTDKTPGKLEDLDNLYKNLLDVVATSYKNIYVKTIIDVVRAPRNLEDGVTPIGFARFKDIVTDRDQPPSAFQLLAYLDGKSEDEYASEQQVKAFTDSANNFFLPTTQLSLYESTSRGAALTGIFANSAKALAMILYKWASIPLTKYSIQLDGREYNSIRRTENNAQGKNIFHTIDTLINAAIDNVKEEILLYVNISSKNSNQFVAAIGLGIPLNDVITIFTHPVIKELSKYRSFELDSNISIEGLKDKVRISKFRSSTGVSIDSLKKSIRKESQLSEEEIHALLGLYYNLTQIGDAIFDATNALSVLNKLPGTPQEISRVMASWSKIVSFSPLEAEDSEGLSRKAKGAYNRAQGDVSRANKLAREGSRSLLFTPNKSWPFDGATLYDIPHIRSILSTLLIMQSLLESMIWQSRKEFDFIATNIHDELGGWAHSAAEDKELIKGHLWRYLTSNLDIKVGPTNLVTTKIPYPQDPDELRFVSDGVAYYQSPASKWMREFEKKIVDIKKVTTGNVLIKNLQFNHKQGLTLVNKTQDPINLAHLQTAFLDMRKLPGHEAPDSMKYSQLQMDLFKYVLLKDGLSFSKVSLSPIFPVEFYSAYSRAMEARMAAVFGHTYSPTSFAKSEILGEAFKYQFLRNRIMDLKWVSYTKRVTKYPSIPQSFDRVYKGANHPDYFRDTSSSSVRVFKKVHVLETENGSFTYYIEIPSTSTAYYEFDFSLFETGFAFEKAVGADNDSRRLFYIDYQGALNFTSEIKDLKVGEVVRIMDRKTASPTVQTIAKIREIAAADEKGKRNLYRFDIIGEESLGSEAQLENLTEISDSYNTRSSVSMPINSLIGVAGKSSFIVMAVGSVDPTKGVAADQTLYRGVSNMSNIKPLVVYDIPAVEAISNIDRFFEEIKDDPRVLAFDRDRLYSLPKSGDLDINVTEYLLSKLREERKYTDTVVSSLETFETLPDTKECN